MESLGAIAAPRHTAANRRLAVLSRQVRGFGRNRHPCAASKARWEPVELKCIDAASAGDQLARMGRGEIPAIVLRDALSAAECKEVLSRLQRAGSFPSTFSARLTSLVGHSVEQQQPPRNSGAVTPATHVAERKVSAGGGTVRGAHRDPNAVRWDVGTSLGNLGHDPDEFFSDAERTHELFRRVLSEPMGRRSPLYVMYSALTDLSGGTKRSMCAEQGGRRYGPGIFRSYQPGGAHGVHFDSVRHRERRSNYSAFEFDVQFAGILLLQAPDRQARPDAGVVDHFVGVGGLAAEVAMRGEASLQDSFIYEMAGKDATATLEAKGQTLKDDFRELAQREKISCAPVQLSAGDMYFFKADNVHEVPAFGGNTSRVVLATFIGWSEHDPRVFVWS